jgi:PAS domain S-box-containing protein
LRGETVAGRELHMVRRDGHAYDVLCSAAPVRGSGGEVLAAVVSFTDITARKRAEAEVRQLIERLEERVRERTAALRKSQAELSALIESTTDAIWSVGRDHRVLAINRLAERGFCERFGARLQIGESFDGRVPEDVAVALRTLFDRALAGERLMIEQRYPVDGAMRHFLVSLNPIQQGDEVVGVTVFSKDITERKRAEQQVRERQAELAHVLRLGTIGEMAAGLAHEINQPLGAIANYAQGCARRLRTAAASAEDLLPIVDAIAHETQRAAEVLRRLRRLVRKEGVRRDTMDLNEIVGEAVRLLRHETEKRAVEVSFAAGQEMPAVRGDAVQIEQVVINLLVNALDAVAARSGGERRIDIRTRSAEDCVGVAVRDNGVGLDPEMAARAFEPFFTTKQGGLGMGLAISRSIIEAHRGRLWATAHAGGGATFEFTLPLTRRR